MKILPLPFIAMLLSFGVPMAAPAQTAAPRATPSPTWPFNSRATPAQRAAAATAPAQTTALAAERT